MGSIFRVKIMEVRSILKTVNVYNKVQSNFYARRIGGRDDMFLKLRGHKVLGFNGFPDNGPLSEF
jgi:hypothetical protein